MTQGASLMQLGVTRQETLIALIRQETRAFAAKIRTARAVLGWNQTELGIRVGVTQRAIHKLEQGETEPRRATVLAMEEVWRDEGVAFEDLPGGGFRVIVPASLLEQPVAGKKRHRAARHHLGVVAGPGRYRT